MISSIDCRSIIYGLLRHIENHTFIGCCGVDRVAEYMAVYRLPHHDIPSPPLPPSSQAESSTFGVTAVSFFDNERAKSTKPQR